MNLNETLVTDSGMMMATCYGFRSSLGGEVASQEGSSLVEEMMAEYWLAYLREEVGAHTPDAQPQAAIFCP